MARFSSLLAVMLAVASADAYAACEGQPGEVIFEDSFEDDYGGWTIHQDAKFANGELTLHNQEPNSNWLYWNNTFNATNGDYCMEVVQPASPSPDNIAAVGLMFLGEAENLFLLQLGSNNAVTMWKKVGANWAQIGNYTDEQLKLAPDTPATLRVTVKDGLIKPFVNEVELRGVRAQIPQGPLKFGIYIQTDRPIPAPGSDFVIREFRVTSGA